MSRKPSSISDRDQVSAQASEKSGDARSRKRVLFVEDNEADAYLIHKALRANAQVGEVVRAKDGLEALSLIEDNHLEPDLAIIDLKMPKMDGFALLRSLKSQLCVEFPLFVLTSSRSGADALRAVKRGSVRFVTKPNTMEKLSMAINQMVEAV
jgi:two-component system response regulator MprA